MLTTQDRELFIAFAVSQGYLGFTGTKYKTKSAITSSADKILEYINFPAKLDPKKDYDLVSLGFRMMSDNTVKVHLAEALRSVPVHVEVIDPNPHRENSSFAKDVIDDNRQQIVDVANKVLFFMHVDGKEKRPEDNILAIDPESRNIVRDIRIDVLLRARNLSPKAVLDSLDAYAVLEFNPYKTDFVIEATRDFYNFRAFNLYNPPAWRRIKNPPAPALTGFIKKVFEHVIVNAEEREFVLDWCHHALVKRNQTILCLAGNKGTGKNLFMEKIMGNIIGLEYFEAVGQAFLEEKFNAPLHNKRYVIMDEVTTNTQEAINSLKRFANDRISVEKKGQDAFTAKNYASMAILSNEITKLGIVTNDRRYSIPEVTKLPLNASVLGDEISEFTQALEANEEWVLRELAQFGYFLLARKPKYSADVPLKGEYFYHIAEYSLPEWVSILLDYLHDQGVPGVPALFVDALKLRNEDKRAGRVFIPTQLRQFQQVLHDFKFRGKFPIGVVERVEGSGNRKSRTYPAIIPDAAFLQALRDDRLYRQSRDERKIPTPLPVMESPDVVSQNDDDYDELESAEGLL